MSAKEKDIESCDSCGASVYPEHLESGKAGVYEGKLFCPHCAAEYKRTHHTDEKRLVGQPSMKAPGEGEELESLSIIGDDEREHTSSFTAMGSETLADTFAHFEDSHLKRNLDPNGAGATRCRTFHAKLNDGAVAFMNKQINEWADEHPKITIKAASSTIGVWEGKKSDPHLILTVFY